MVIRLRSVEVRKFLSLLFYILLELARLFCFIFLQRHDVMKRLIQRYLLTVEKTRHQTPAPELVAERDESQQLRELITRLEGVLRKTESERPPDVAKKTDSGNWSDQEA